MKAGQMFTVAYGVYSDKGWLGPFRCLKDFNMTEQSKLYIAEIEKANEGQDWGDDPEIGGLIAFLARNLLIEDVDCYQFRTPDYSWEFNGLEDPDEINK